MDSKTFYEIQTSFNFRSSNIDTKTFSPFKCRKFVAYFFSFTFHLIYIKRSQLKRFCTTLISVKLLLENILYLSIYFIHEVKRNAFISVHVIAKG